MGCCLALSPANRSLVIFMALPSISITYGPLTRRRTAGGIAGQGRTRPGRRRPASGLRTRRATPSLWIGAIITAIFVLAGLLAPLLAPYPPDQVGVGASLEAPSLAHLVGTDLLGRDQFSRVLHGASIALGMAILGVGMSALVGVTLGLLAGYFGGWMDQALSRLMDLWMAFPGLLLAIIIVARLGPSLRNAVLALGIVGVPGFYRLVRGTALSERENTYVEAAQAIGAGHARVMLRHILPNLLSPLIVLITTRFGILILSGGALSFIGLGAQPPTPEWGALLASGRDYMDLAPWLAIYPGLCITLTVAGLNLLGDGLRDRLSPRQPNCYR
jgi:ABC-type dipeptide/oligopeptide/nickel transport system permease subunit